MDPINRPENIEFVLSVCLSVCPPIYQSILLYNHTSPSAVVIISIIWSNVKAHQSEKHVFILFWTDALPGLAVLFAVFNQVLQIIALIYKDAWAIVTVRVFSHHQQLD